MPRLVILGFVLSCLSSLSAPAQIVAQPLSPPHPTGSWPEDERAFFEDGGALLLSPAERERWLALDPADRQQAIAGLLRTTPELGAAIARRRDLGFTDLPATGDARFVLRFLHGEPIEVQRIDCGDTFVPLEIWTIRGAPQRQVLIYQSSADEGFRLWRPSDGKPALYTPLLQGWLEAWENRRGQFEATRFDLRTCRETRMVDRVTGVPGLAAFGEYRGANRKAIDNRDLFAPPADLAGWARAAAAEPAPASDTRLTVDSLSVDFPTSDGSRVVAEFALELPPGAASAAAEEGGEPTLLLRRLSAHGFLERDGRAFERFRLRFRLPVESAALAESQPTALAFERRVRPSERFVLRLWLRDEVSGREVRLDRGFVAPAPENLGQRAGIAPLPGAARAEEIDDAPPPPRDSLTLMPPIEDAVAVTWRATALVTGRRIRQVAFSVDGARQLTVSKPPYSVELRLQPIPVEQVVRVEGLDADGKVVLTDELILNPQGGRLGIRIVEPSGQVGDAREAAVRVAVAIPTGRTIRAVELRLNDQPPTTLETPPWQVLLPLPADELVFLVADVVLDDGTRASTTRTLRSSGFVEDVEVQTVELYLSATDRSGRFVRDLQQKQVAVIEGGKPQEIQRFEWVKVLPLRLGVVLDASGSMSSSLAEAQNAGVAFLQALMKPGDQAFLQSFNDRPNLHLPLTDDVGALVFALRGIQTHGGTALHDAVVQALRQLAGTKGQRALVVLSDGDDNSSAITFQNAVEYARRSGTVIFTIGLDLPASGFGVRNKLQELASSTGGKAFFAGKASQLQTIYADIEEELRSRYLIVYQRSGACAEEAEARAACPVEVKLPSGMKARVTRVVGDKPPL